MKKFNATFSKVVLRSFILVALFGMAFSFKSFGQCTNGAAFGTVTAPTTPTPITISGCTFAGEYNTINNAVAGATYQFTGTGGAGNYLTIRQGTPGGVVLAFGFSPVSATVTVSGPIYNHVNTTAACGTDGTCHTTTVACTSCVAPPPPANDLCANATVIAVPSATAGTTVNSTFDNVGTCGTTNTTGGVWYTFTNNVGNGSNRVRLNTCTGTAYDSKLSVFTGTCAALTCVNGNDDFCGLQSQVDVTTAGANTTYRVLVHGFGTATGAFTLSALQLASITNIALGAQTACDPATNLYTQTLTLTYLNAPTTGTILVNGQSFPITGSPQTVVLTGLTSNGLPVNVTASFSADPASSVTLNNFFTAPIKCNLCKVNCPADIAVTLAAGECQTFVNYNITTSGDCTASGIVNNFQGPFAPANWTVGLVNSNGNVNTAGAPASVVINGTDGLFGAGQTNYSTTIGFTGLVTFTWNYTTIDSPFWDPFGYTINGVFTQVTNTGGPNTQSGTVSVNVPAGAVFGFSQRSLDNFGGPGITTISNFSAPATITLSPTQTAGLPSGSAFGIGMTTNTFTIPNGIGGTSTCSFKVTVNEFPNPTQTLACNDLVQISLDEECEAVIGADQILEGGPYGCYDSRYTVMVLSPLGANLGNTVYGSLPNPVNTNFANGQQWTVKVTDKVTGQSCWGKIIVEDKLPPVIECRNQTIACTEEPILAPAPALVGPQIQLKQPFDIIENGPTTSPRIYNFDYSYIPTGTPVLDVDLRIKLTGHTWLPDLDMVITAPDGSTVDAFTLTGCFGQEWPIDVWFDDEGQGNITQCVTLNAGGAHLQPICAPGVSCQVLNGFDGKNAGGQWVVTISDNFAGDDGVIEEVGLAVTVNLPAVPALDNCAGELTLANGGLKYVDSSTPGACGSFSKQITRTWTATDAHGNSASCAQVITFERPTLDDVDAPADIKWTCDQYNAFPNIVNPTALHPYITDTDLGTTVIDVNLSPTCDDQDLSFQDNANINSTNVANGGLGCPGNGLDDADVLALTGSGIPGVNGRPLVSICGIGYEHQDVLVNICPGTFKIVRKWTIIDWCANPVGVKEVNQVIKVVDEVAPTITAPADQTINVYNASTPPNSAPHAVCKGTVVVPPATGIADNCSGVTGYTTELWTVNNANQPVAQIATIATNGGLFNGIELYINGLPAKYLARYYAVDGCGNQSFDDAIYTLRDKVPPVAVCDEITEVSIINNSVGTGGSCSTLFAHNLDDGSYDNCAPVYFLMAKMSDALSPNIFNRCYYKSRDFCCDDIGDQTVILLVLDGDPTPFMTFTTPQPALGCDGTPGLLLSATANYPFNYNTCMVTVQVTDKLPPVLISCPPNQRITCDNFATNLETQLQGLTSAQQCGVLTAAGYGEPVFYDNCQADVTCTTNINLDQCLEGSISRTWSAKDGAGNSGTQTCTQTIFVDHVSDWVVEFPADITVNCGANVPDFGEPEIFFETCELVGVSYKDELFNVVPDACYKILRTWTVINWCVVGDLIDQEVVESSERAFQIAFPLEPCDFDGDGDCDTRTFRDSWRVSPKSQPGAAQATSTTNPDTDPDSDPWDGYITYQQVIKVNDTVDPIFTNGCQIPDVCIEDNTCGATVLLPTPEITECSANVTLTAQIRIGGVWLNGFGPYLNVAPGTYEVRYKAIDNCNNQKDCNTTVTVRDCKKPTPYCKNGLVIELMQTGMVQLWANDFNAGSFDNCTPAAQLKISFSANVNDTGKTFDCTTLGQQPIQMWVTDLAGNQDYCETFVIVQDNMGACDDDPQIAGVTATAGNQGVQGVNININSPSGFGANTTTNANGAYSVNVPSGNDYTITPVLDTNPLNGVSTFDLVLISKHILGVQLLDSPYKIIAADANKSNSVTTFDLVEIRKLILFINTDFPNNTSWRFVKKSHTFGNPANPFAAQFPEVINLNNLTADALAQDFVAIKVGDVNGSAAVNLTGGANEDRTMVGDLVLNADDVTVEAGKTYTVNFKATDFNVSGYQFTLNFDNSALELVEVVPGLAEASNFGLTMVNEGIITTSWNSDEAKQLAKDEVVFGLTFKALSSGRMSKLVSINSRYTVAEAYNANAELMNVAMSFNNQLAAGGFELYQNTPNPFASVTNIGFYLPEATSATLTISDVQGKVVKVMKVDAVKGYNQVSLKRGELGATGVMYYRLDTDTDSATRKMILVD